MYEDDTGELSLVIIQGRLFVAAVPSLDLFSVSMVKHWMGVLGSVESDLRARGVSSLYCVVKDWKGFRFAEVMGFRLVPENVNGYDVMEKPL